MSHDLSRIELVLLARLSVSGTPPGASKIADDMARLAPSATKGEWKARIDPLLEGLRGRGLIDGRRRLTDAGRRSLRERLGTQKAPSWLEVRDRLLPALALGLDVDSKVVLKGEALQAALVGRQLGLPAHDTLASLLDQLVVSELGLPPGKVTLDRIRSHVLARRLGITVRSKGHDVARELVGQAAAAVVRAPRGELRHLRAALARSWIAETGDQADVSPASTAVAAPVVHESGFASMVEEAIAAIGTDGRFGPYKVFISAIWRKLASDPRRKGLTQHGFAQSLLDANRSGVLSLARADLVGAMDRDEVARSEISDRGATFHFVLDASRTP